MVAVDVMVAHIDSELRRAGDPDRAVHEKAYLKSDLEFTGTGVPDTRRIAKAAWREIHPAETAVATATNAVAIAEALFARPVHECRGASVELLVLAVPLLNEAHVPALERLLRASKTWALVDPLATGVMGPLVVRLRHLETTLDRWSADGDFWVRRASILSLLPSLRAPDADTTRLIRYADAMVDEKEFFIRKAIGWVMRETGRRQPDIVFGWLMRQAGHTSGVTSREAVKYLSDEQRTVIDASTARRPRRLSDR